MTVSAGRHTCRRRKTWDVDVPRPWRVHSRPTGTAEQDHAMTCKQTPPIWNQFSIPQCVYLSIFFLLTLGTVNPKEFKCYKEDKGQKYGHGKWRDTEERSGNERDLGPLCKILDPDLLFWSYFIGIYSRDPMDVCTLYSASFSQTVGGLLQWELLVYSGWQYLSFGELCSRNDGGQAWTARVCHGLSSRWQSALCEDSKYARNPESYYINSA